MMMMMMMMMMITMMMLMPATMTIIVVVVMIDTLKSAFTNFLSWRISNANIDSVDEEPYSISLFEVIHEQYFGRKSQSKGRAPSGPRPPAAVELQ